MSKKKAVKKAAKPAAVKTKKEKTAVKPAAKAKPVKVNAKAEPKPAVKAKTDLSKKNQKQEISVATVNPPKEALKKEVSKKKETVTVAEAGEPVVPGQLTKQQIKSLEKLIQKNAEWSLISDVLSQNARPYKMQDAYQDKMAIKHPVLGLGYVTLAENHKMTVLFKDGSRNLIMNYKS